VTDTTFKVKRSRSPGRLLTRRVGMSGGCSGGRENVLVVGNCCYVAVCSAVEDASAPTGAEGRGHTVVAARLQLVSNNFV